DRRRLARPARALGAGGAGQTVGGSRGPEMASPRWTWMVRMGCMAELRTAHTADLDSATRKAARALLDDVFDDMTDDDWEHALGGGHALVGGGADLIGHGAGTQRRRATGGRGRGRGGWG